MRIVKQVVGLSLASLLFGAAPALAAGAHTVPWDPYKHGHYHLGRYFKEEVKLYKPGYGYTVSYHTCLYSKVFDSRGYAFLKKTCGH